MKLNRYMLRKLLLEALSSTQQGTATQAEVKEAIKVSFNEEYVDPKIIWMDNNSKAEFLHYFLGGASTEIGGPGEVLTAKNSDLIAEKIFGQSNMKYGANFNVGVNSNSTDLQNWVGYGLDGSTETFPSVDVCFWSDLVNDSNNSNPFISDGTIKKLTGTGSAYDLIKYSSDEMVALSVKFSGGFRKWAKSPTTTSSMAKNKHNFSQENKDKLGRVVLMNIAVEKLKRVFSDYKTYILNPQNNLGVISSAPAVDQKIAKFLALVHASNNDLTEGLTARVIQFWLNLTPLNVITTSSNVELRMISDSDVEPKILEGSFETCFANGVEFNVGGFEMTAAPHASANLGIVAAVKHPLLAVARKLDLEELTYIPGGSAVCTHDGEVQSGEIEAFCVIADNLEDFLQNYRTSYTQMQSGGVPTSGAKSLDISDDVDFDSEFKMKHRGESIILTSIYQHFNRAAGYRNVQSLIAQNHDSVLSGLIDKQATLSNEFQKSIFQPLVKRLSSLDREFFRFMEALGLKRSDIDMLELSSFDLFKSDSQDAAIVANIVDIPSVITGYDSNSPQVQGIIKLIEMIEKSVGFIANIEYALQIIVNEHKKLRPNVINLTGLTLDIHEKFAKRIYFTPPSRGKYGDNTGGAPFILGSDPSTSDDEEVNLRMRAQKATTDSVLLKLPDYPALNVVIPERRVPSIKTEFVNFLQEISNNKVNLNNYFTSVKDWIENNENRYGATLTTFLNELSKDITTFKADLDKANTALEFISNIDTDKFDGMKTESKHDPDWNDYRSEASTEEEPKEEEYKKVVEGFKLIKDTLKISNTIESILALPNPNLSQYDTKLSRKIGGTATHVPMYPSKSSKESGKRVQLGAEERTSFKDIFQGDESEIREPLEMRDVGTFRPATERIFNQIKLTKIISSLENFINVANTQSTTIDNLIQLDLSATSSSETEDLKELRALKSFFEEIQNKLESNAITHDELEKLIEDGKDLSKAPTSELLKPIFETIAGVQFPKPSIASSMRQAFIDILSFIDLAFLADHGSFKYFKDDDKRVELQARLANIMNTFANSENSILTEFLNPNDLKTLSIKMIYSIGDVVSLLLKAYVFSLIIDISKQLSPTVEALKIVTDYYKEIRENMTSIDSTNESKLYESIIKDILKLN